MQAAALQQLGSRPLLPRRASTVASVPMMRTQPVIARARACSIHAAAAVSLQQQQKTTQQHKQQQQQQPRAMPIGAARPSLAAPSRRHDSGDLMVCKAAAASAGACLEWCWPGGAQIGGRPCRARAFASCRAPRAPAPDAKIGRPMNAAVCPLQRMALLQPRKLAWVRVPR